MVVVPVLYVVYVTGDGGGACLICCICGVFVVSGEGFEVLGVELVSNA